MLFSELLELAGMRPSAREGEAEVAAVCCDSRKCNSKSVFVAVDGTNLNGHDYIPQAIANGAAAVVCRNPENIPQGTTFAVVDDTHLAVALLAQAVKGWPVKKLRNIGVTGTNGKSTIANLLHAALNSMNVPTGKIGTITYETGRRTIVARMTSPGPLELADLTAEMVDAGMENLVMEVSSHAIDQQRIAGIDFDAAIFTNLTGDHLDYHKTMEEYFNVKARLFENLRPDAAAIINRDDPKADELADHTDAKITFYGLNPLSDVRGCIRNIDADGTNFELFIDGDKFCDAHTPLIGRHNIFNILAAVAICRAIGLDLNAAVDAICRVSAVPGRLQRVPTDENYYVFVDYAHTDDALSNVLGALRPITPGDIIVVFGCGGDRDRTKRPRMANVAQNCADRIIVTSDNPRNEDPKRIIDDIMTGFDADVLNRVAVHPDRKTAIFAAVAQAGEGDVVIIAGKGHENYQIVKGLRNHFDDVEQAQAAIAQRQGDKRR